MRKRYTEEEPSRSQALSHPKPTKRPPMELGAGVSPGRERVTTPAAPALLGARAAKKGVLPCHS